MCNNKPFYNYIIYVLSKLFKRVKVISGERLCNFNKKRRPVKLKLKKKEDKVDFFLRNSPCSYA